MALPGAAKRARKVVESDTSSSTPSNTASSADSISQLSQERKQWLGSDMSHEELAKTHTIRDISSGLERFLCQFKACKSRRNLGCKIKAFFKLVPCSQQLKHDLQTCNNWRNQASHAHGTVKTFQYGSYLEKSNTELAAFSKRMRTALIALKPFVDNTPKLTRAGSVGSTRTEINTQNSNKTTTKNRHRMHAQKSRRMYQCKAQLHGRTRGCGVIFNKWKQCRTHCLATHHCVSIGGPNIFTGWRKALVVMFDAESPAAEDIVDLTILNRDGSCDKSNPSSAIIIDLAGTCSQMSTSPTDSHTDARDRKSQSGDVYADHTINRSSIRTRVNTSTKLTASTSIRPNASISTTGGNE